MDLPASPEHLPLPSPPLLSLSLPPARLPASALLLQTCTSSSFMHLGGQSPAPVVGTVPSCSVTTAPRVIFCLGLAFVWGFCSKLGWLSANESLKQEKGVCSKGAFCGPQPSACPNPAPRAGARAAWVPSEPLSLPQFPSVKTKGVPVGRASYSLQGWELRKEVEEEVPPLLGAG